MRASSRRSSPPNSCSGPAPAARMQPSRSPESASGATASGTGSRVAAIPALVSASMTSAREDERLGTAVEDLAHQVGREAELAYGLVRSEGGADQHVSGDPVVEQHV